MAKKKRRPAATAPAPLAPFTPIRFSDILRVHRRPRFAAGHPLYPPPGSAADTAATVSLMLTQLLATSVSSTAPPPPSAACLQQLRALLQQLLRNRRRCRPGPLLERRCRGADAVPPGVLAAALIRLTLRLVPLDLLGPGRLDHVIRHLLQLGRFDVLCVGDVTRGLRMRGRAWLKQEEPELAVHLLARAAVWTLRVVVLDTLRAYFYVTELLPPRLQLGFFWRPDWESRVQQQLTRLVDDGALEPVTSSAADPDPAPPWLRFMPKSSGGLRPVMSAPPSGPLRDRCRQLLAVMRHEALVPPERAPPPRQLHQLWRRFIGSVSGADGSVPPLWYVRVDVRDACGSVRHSVLLPLLREALARLPARLTLCRRADGRYVLWDERQSGARVEVETQEVMHQLESLVTDQRLRYGRQMFHMRRGLAQGAPLSAALCDMYYGAMLRRAVPWCFEPASGVLLLRTMDDILMVTPSQASATRFHSVLLKGMPEFHCFFNKEKTRTNVTEEPTAGSVNMSGNCFHLPSAEVSADMSPYSGVDMRFTLRTSSLRSPGLTLRRRLHTLCAFRLSPLHWDPRVNSTQRLQTSLREHLVVTARRYVALLSRLRLDRDERNTAFLAGAAELCWRRIRSVLARFAREGGYRAWATSGMARRLGASAFARVLPPHLEALREAVRAQGRRKRTCAPRDGEGCPAVVAGAG